MIERLIAIESPFAAKTEEGQLENLRYAMAAMRYVFLRELVPFAGHLHFTLVLNEHNPPERKMGMKAGFVIADAASQRWFFLDRGMSTGMSAGMTRAARIGQPRKEIMIGEDWPNLVKDISDETLKALFLWINNKESST